MGNLKLASMIDHTVLKAFATRDEIIECCEQAKKYKFASVCVNPCHVKLAAEILEGTLVKVCTVIGFPLGANATETKVFETEKAIMDGALEIDMVINIGALKEGNFSFVENDIRSVVNAAKCKGAIVKVIIETCYLSDEEKVKVCQIAQNAGADFVKTSTGFGTNGALIEDVTLMRKIVGESMGVKASGNIKNISDANNMIMAGASRIGTSSGISILEG